jgi:Domain of unknown function (DUF4082)
MKKLLVFFVAVTAFAQNPAVTSVSMGNVSHSVTQVVTNYSGSPQNLRMRFVQAPGVCTSMTGGTVQPSSWNGLGRALPSNPISQGVGGLSPSTTYNICPEISADGTNWFGGVSVSVTTLPLPNPHPALPIPPATFNTGYPNTTGFTTYTMNSSCVDASNGRTLLQRINDAISAQKAHGTVITIPAGTTCTGQIYPSAQAPDVYTFGASAVSTAASTITISNHGFTEGQGLKFGTQYGCLPGSNNQSTCHSNGSGPIIEGWIYYACNVTTNTFQVCNKPIAQGGTPFTFTNTGNGTELVMPWPRNLNWIIVRTATPDSQFVPVGVRLQGPILPASQSPLASTAPVSWVPTAPTNWLPKMAVLRMPNTFAGPNGQNVLFNADGTNYEQTAYIRFVGIQFTYTPTPDGSVSSNVIPHYDFVDTNQWNDDIIFDRCWFHALPPPDRATRLFWWNGMNMAIINSYLDNMQFYHPTYVGGFTTNTSSTTFTVNPFTYNWGTGLFRSPTQLTITTSGNSGTSNKTGWVYVDPSSSTVNVALPPGVTGTCSGGSGNICNVFTASTNGVFNTTGSFPGGTGGGASGNNYWVDPIFSTGSSCGSTSTLLSADPLGGSGNFYSGNSFEVGVRFSSNVSGYICGVRYYKNASETGTHIGRLWIDSSGSLLASATFTGETSSGWQTVQFSSPVAITANTVYVASMGSNVGLLLVSGYYNNHMVTNGPLSAPANYVTATGSYDYADKWPKNALGNNAVAQLSYVTFNNGAIVSSGQADATSQQWDPEGCQCMVGGIGPGPYIFSNNYIEATGTVWHHDDGGGNWATRGDYTYTRNYAITRKSQMADSSGANPEWDGLRYFHRHIFEWKAGLRINFSGNVYGGAWVEDTPLGDMVEFSGTTQPGASDVNVENNTFAHATTLIYGPSEYPATGVGGSYTVKSQPSQRFRFRNNLAWDVNGNTWCAHGFGFCGSNGGWGVVFWFGDDDEDWTVDHNTIVGNQGQEPDFLWTTEGLDEGFKFTNNIFYIGGTGLLGGIDTGNTCGMGGTDSQCYGAGKSCRNLSGLNAWNCGLLNSVIDHNVLTGAPSQATIQNLWPNGSGYSNYVPSSPSNLGALGWFSYNGLTSQANDYHLKSNFCSGCGQSGNDGTDVGANMDALLSAQGAVKLIGVPNSSITATSATVVFDTYNLADACSVDYSSTDPTLVSSFTRASNPGGSVVNNIALTGLSAGTLYYYRINCPTNQPTGQFRTR